MKLKTLATFSLLVLTLSGCQPVETVSPTPSPSEDFVGITITSSTNVWGGIAKEIGGDLVQVVSIIDSPNQDPHSYEASARDQLAVNDADLVIANGGGYDSFMDQLAESAGKEIFYAFEKEAVEKEEADHDHDHGHENEHIWYDYLMVADFGERLTSKLSELEPESTSMFEENLVSFLDNIELLSDRTASLSSGVNGSGFVSSEPIADYLLDFIGLENITPSSFADAIEEERDLSPKVLLEVQNLLKSGTPRLFVVNIQTSSSQIEALTELAVANKVSVIEVSELMPEGLNYFEWMSENLNQIEAALY
jgi:zinc/manganese transport system substrate-binding protein